MRSADIKRRNRRKQSYREQENSKRKYRRERERERERERGGVKYLEARSLEVSHASHKYPLSGYAYQDGLPARRDN